MRRAQRTPPLSLHALTCSICTYVLVADGFLTLQGTSFASCSRRQRFDTNEDLVKFEKPIPTSLTLLLSSSPNSELFPERLNIIYDSKCSVCQWEVDNLTYLMSKLPGAENADRPKLIRFTDLESNDGYDETDPANGGITYEEGMRSFRAVRPDGSTIKGIEVFKQAYSIVEFYPNSWLWQWTNIPWLRAIADWGYKMFAGIRTDVTRGSRVEDLIDLHYATSNSDECEPCKQKLTE